MQKPIFQHLKDMFPEIAEELNHKVPPRDRNDYGCTIREGVSDDALATRAILGAIIYFDMRFGLTGLGIDDPDSVAAYMAETIDLYVEEMHFANKSLQAYIERCVREWKICSTLD